MCATVHCDGGSVRAWPAPFGFFVNFSSDSGRASGRRVTDYIWRWDTDWFWCTQIFPLMSFAPMRALCGRGLLRSDMYKRVSGHLPHPRTPSARSYSRTYTTNLRLDILQRPMIIITKAVCHDTIHGSDWGATTSQGQ